MNKNIKVIIIVLILLLIFILLFYKSPLGKDKGYEFYNEQYRECKQNTVLGEDCIPVKVEFTIVDLTKNPQVKEVSDK